MPVSCMIRCRFSHSNVTSFFQSSRPPTASNSSLRTRMHLSNSITAIKMTKSTMTMDRTPWLQPLHLRCSTSRRTLHWFDWLRPPIRLSKDSSRKNFSKIRLALWKKIQLRMKIASGYSRGQWRTLRSSPWRNTHNKSNSWSCFKGKETIHSCSVVWEVIIRVKAKQSLKMMSVKTIIHKIRKDSKLCSLHKPNPVG